MSEIESDGQIGKSDRPKTKVVQGERVGKQGKIRLGCSAVLFDENGESVLLTRRSDNGQWCLPGGMIDPGESVAEGCEREVREETGLDVRVVRLVGVYSDPNLLTIYPDGNAFQVIVLCFMVERLGGEMGLSNETTDIRFFPLPEALQADLFHGHAGHIQDAVAGQVAAFVR